MKTKIEIIKCCPKCKNKSALIIVKKFRNVVMCEECGYVGHEFIEMIDDTNRLWVSEVRQGYNLVYPKDILKWWSYDLLDMLYGS